MYTYILYIKYNSGNYKTFTKVCNKPKMTKIYKQLKNELNTIEKDVNFIGYTIASKFNYKDLL